MCDETVASQCFIWWIKTIIPFFHLFLIQCLANETIDQLHFNESMSIICEKKKTENSN